jgi:hypothetical protein
LNKKVFLPLIILAIIALLAGAGILFWSTAKPGTGLAEPTPTLAPTATPTEEVPEEEEEETVSDLELIKEALAEKHSKPLEETTVTIDENTGTYANGGVKFEGEIGGAWWLAYHDASGWIIVADGNGTVLCSDIEPYNFPVDMVPECWDETTSTLITR